MSDEYLKEKSGEGEKNFFYHSFPRPKEGQDHIAKGLLILESIIKSGLLLTPEDFSFREEVEQSNPSSIINVFQCRVCFTEIPEYDLFEHSKHFGEFALEWEAKKLRQFHACPVFYVPYDQNEKVWRGAMGTMLARFAEIQELLKKLNLIKDLTLTTKDPDDVLGVLKDDGTRFHFCRNRDAQGFLSVLESQGQPIESLLNSISALASLFYPVENLKYDKELSYYRQREWRIISNIIYHGVNLTRELTEEEIQTLLEIDKKFYSKIKKFPKSGEGIIAKQCRFFQIVNNQRVVETIRRIIVPENAFENTIKLLKKYNLSTEAVRLEDIPKR